jgi:hypothetical protein
MGEETCKPAFLLLPFSVVLIGETLTPSLTEVVTGSLRATS